MRNPATEDAKMVRRHLRRLEKEADLVSELRGHAKTDGGRMTDFGKMLLASARDSGIKQAFIAKLLGISPGAVSQHYSK